MPAKPRADDRVKHKNADLAMEENPDGIILKLIRDKHSAEEGFLLLVRTYQQRLYWHIRRMLDDHDDTDDVLQETFIKAWKGIRHFREESQLFTWLYRIATNEALSFLRKREKDKKLSLQLSREESPVQVEPGTPPGGEVISMKLRQAVVRLPEKQRLVFNMKYYDEMKYEEMSAILGTSVGALKASYHLAVKKIENLLDLD